MCAWPALYTCPSVPDSLQLRERPFLRGFCQGRATHQTRGGHSRSHCPFNKFKTCLPYLDHVFSSSTSQVSAVLSFCLSPDISLVGPLPFLTGIWLSSLSCVIPLSVGSLALKILLLLPFISSLLLSLNLSIVSCFTGIETNGCV